MKLNPLLFIICCLALFLSCEEDNSIVNETANSITTLPPKNIIPVTDANIMYQEYGAERAKFLEENLIKKSSLNSYQATRTFMLDFQTLKQYITYIEQESLNAGVNIESLGFYFSKYPDNNGKLSFEIKNQNAGAETLFLNPMATFNTDSESVSYAIQKKKNGESRAVPVGEVLKLIKNKEITANEIKSLAGNHGGKRPPPSTITTDYGDESDDN
ncbi:hypothetical protein [uncultured Dokdonia sp.]|uniref:hypothetical protein n=1 Tax=uncultured Dokdonia sp. TaxID=575653 RepID=UPI00261F9292|nr:hypothetical protein [uncultured Dokdonia sp.]